MWDINNKDLFLRYIEVCNKALKKNKDIFPYAYILEALQNKGNGQFIEVTIIDEVPTYQCLMGLQGNRIVGQTIPSTSQNTQYKKWHITRRYLEDLVHHPEEYINNPAKINWDWVG